MHTVRCLSPRARPQSEASNWRAIKGRHCEERFARRSNLDRTSEIGPRLLPRGSGPRVAMTTLYRASS
jgi:hypothetical protein